VAEHQKLYEHQGSVATIQMGARPNLPAPGRFLSGDSIARGVSNSYDNPADPINKLDSSVAKSRTYHDGRGSSTGTRALPHRER